MENRDIVYLKARLLEEALIDIPEKATGRHPYDKFSSRENLYASEQIFLLLNASVKIRLSVSEKSHYILKKTSSDSFSIISKKDGKVLITGVKVLFLESELLHSPDQALFNLYKKCSRNCAYCPLPLNKEEAEFMDSEKFKEIFPEIKKLSIKGIGFTTGIPHGWTEDNLVVQMVNIVREIRKNIGDAICISAAPPPLDKQNIKRLKEAGLNEIRINIEVYNPQLFNEMCPGFGFEYTKAAIINAADIFGRNKVSTNMVIGLGETDDNVIEGIEFFASKGVLTTLSPLDIVPERKDYLKLLLHKEPERPTAERIYKLADRHKEIYKKYNITLKNGVQTMCSACGFCNMAPMIDF